MILTSYSLHMVSTSLREQGRVQISLELAATEFSGSWVNVQVNSKAVDSIRLYC
jgi:hypothetical protein